MMTITTHSADETKAFAAFLASLLKGHELIFLEGILGAGKTTFTQGLGTGLQISERVNSPTFILMKEYEGQHHLVHIDAYRLEGINQDLGFEDYLDGQSIVIIEWAKYIEHLIGQPDLRITLELVEEDTRLIHIKAASELLKEIAQYEH